MELVSETVRRAAVADANYFIWISVGNGRHVGTKRRAGNEQKAKHEISDKGNSSGFTV